MTATIIGSSIDRFEYEALPGRVVFGPGRVAETADEVNRLGARRALLIDGLQEPELVERVARSLGPLHVGTLAEVRPHVPAGVASHAREVAAQSGADCLVALGGGSAIGVAKAVALTDRIPIIAVPTTYAGSEMTPIWGITEQRHKTTGRDVVVLPRTVIYDPELTLALPPKMTGASGINAVAHCVEAMWTRLRNPITDAVASEAIALLARGLRGSVREPRDLQARSQALQGAWLAGTTLAVAGTALHHKICHVLGGAFDLPHADVHAAVLPCVVEHLDDAVPGVLTRVARALDCDDAVGGLRALAHDLGVSVSLSELGLSASQLDRAAELVAAEAPADPRPVTARDVRAILERAG